MFMKLLLYFKCIIIIHIHNMFYTRRFSIVFKTNLLSKKILCKEKLGNRYLRFLGLNSWYVTGRVLYILILICKMLKNY